MRYYILEDKIPKPVKDVLEWADWFETADRVVKKDMIDDVCVSTVFLGIDHSFYKDRSELFETMIFGGKEDQHCMRCATWREAEIQHQKAINIIKGENILKEL